MLIKDIVVKSKRVAFVTYKEIYTAYAESAWDITSDTEASEYPVIAPFHANILRALLIKDQKTIASLCYGGGMAAVMFGFLPDVEEMDEIFIFNSEKEFTDHMSIPFVLEVAMMDI